MARKRYTFKEFTDDLALMGFSVETDLEFTVEELRKRHKALVKEVHPDKPGGDLEKTKDLNVAHDRLREWVDKGRPGWAQRRSEPPKPSAATEAARAARAARAAAEEQAREEARKQSEAAQRQAEAAAEVERTRAATEAAARAAMAAGARRREQAAARAAAARQAATQAAEDERAQAAAAAAARTAAPEPKPQEKTAGASAAAQAEHRQRMEEADRLAREREAVAARERERAIITAEVEAYARRRARWRFALRLVFWPILLPVRLVWAVGRRLPVVQLVAVALVLAALLNWSSIRQSRVGASLPALPTVAWSFPAWLADAVKPRPSVAQVPAPWSRPWYNTPGCRRYSTIDGSCTSN